MIKKFYKLCFFIMVIIIFPNYLSVGAATNRGTLVHYTDNVLLNDSGITINGYAFIKNTNNYVTVYKRNSNGEELPEIVKDNGGQMVSIRVLDESKKVVVEKKYECKNTPDGYNFYYQMYSGFPRDGNKALNNYNNPTFSEKNKNGYYYEDLEYKINFEIEELLSKTQSGVELSFEIAAYKWTDYEPLLILNVDDKTQFIDLKTSINTKIKLLPSDAILQHLINPHSYHGNGTYLYGKENSYYYIYDYNSLGYEHGVLSSNKNYNIDFLKNTIAPQRYAVCANFTDNNYKHGRKYTDGCAAWDAEGFCISCGGIKSNGSFDSYNIVSLWQSWIDISNDNQLKIEIIGSGCKVTDPDKNSGVLQCNNGKTYNSTCEELMVSTDEGGARVKIEQNGNITSVLTPDRVYAGGGFNFGIMYYNTIKWSYVSGQNIDSNSKLHKAVTDAMNKKIKDYESYIAGVNISNLQMDGKTFNMVKQCTTSNKNKDYYDKELTVSCLFTIPSSTIDKVGNVSYTYSSGVNINNKYYTPMNYNGNYKITADIVGMDRITDNAAKRDSKESGKKWTGDWSDTFTNCQINLYTLISGIPKFIYRPIDITNPFPNRNAGINWFDWYNITRNKDRLENTYSGVDKVDYTVTLDNNAITDIKNYNKNNNYLEWDSIDKVTNESSFITEKDYIVRGGN